MTDAYSAYDRGLPCKNPNCASHGKPHPNCKCYAGLAEGGSVKRFCDLPQTHSRDCEYYAEGGEAGASEPLQDDNPGHSIAGHIANNGLLGLMKIDRFQDLDKYHRSIKNGHKNIDTHLETLFNNQKIPRENRAEHHKKIDDWISSAGITGDIQKEAYNQNDPQSFAHGGAVKPSEGISASSAIEQIRPDHNFLLQSTKGHVSNYLSALKPQEYAARMPLDDAPDDTAQKKKYKKAIEVADQPLSILRHISHGTLEQDHMQHLAAMYPEVKDLLQKKATEKIIEAQLENKKPNRVIRQGLGSLLESPLSASMTPQSIQAAQAVLTGKRPQQGQETAPKKSSIPLSKSDEAFLTGSQALLKRDQRQA